MKKRIEEHKQIGLALAKDIEDYIKDYAGLTDKDKVKYNMLYSYIDIDLEYLGIDTIWPLDEIKNFKLNEVCSPDSKPQTAEELKYTLEQKELRKKIPMQVFMAYKYIINHTS